MGEHLHPNTAKDANDSRDHTKESVCCRREGMLSPRLTCTEGVLSPRLTRPEGMLSPRLARLQLPSKARPPGRSLPSKARRSSSTRVQAEQDGPKNFISPDRTDAAVRPMVPFGDFLADSAPCPARPSRSASGRLALVAAASCGCGAPGVQSIAFSALSLLRYGSN